jgi:hypothetical protein
MKSSTVFLLLVVLIVGLGIGGWLGYTRAAGSPAIVKRGGNPIGTGTDPPIIIHGGSFHVTLKKETYDPVNKQFVVPVTDLTKFGSSGYGTVSLPASWAEIQMCTDETCQHGVYLNSGANNTVTIKVVSLADFVAKGGTSVDGRLPQTDYEIQGNNLGEFYPKVLMIHDAKNMQTSFTCTPVSKVDWSNCWIEVGTAEATAN